MPADPPPQLLISPDLRRRLQQRYEEAARLSAKSKADLARVHSLLAECVSADPGNLLYVDAMLANLRRREAQPGRSWWRRWLTWLERRPKHSMEAGHSNAEATSPTDAGGTEYKVLS